jgi:hypothetical protein
MMRGSATSVSVVLGFADFELIAALTTFAAASNTSVSPPTISTGRCHK